MWILRLCIFNCSFLSEFPQTIGSASKKKKYERKIKFLPPSTLYIVFSKLREMNFPTSKAGRHARQVRKRRKILFWIIKQKSVVDDVD